MDVFLIEDNDLLEKYDTAWVKISFNTEKESDSEPLYNKKKFGNQTKSYGDKATGFHDKEIPKVGSNHTCLAVITIDSSSNHY